MTKGKLNRVKQNAKIKAPRMTVSLLVILGFMS